MTYNLNLDNRKINGNFASNFLYYLSFRFGLRTGEQNTGKWKGMANFPQRMLLGIQQQILKVHLTCNFKQITRHLTHLGIYILYTLSISQDCLISIQCCPWQTIKIFLGTHNQGHVQTVFGITVISVMIVRYQEWRTVQLKTQEHFIHQSHLETEQQLSSYIVLLYFCISIYVDLTYS